MTSAQHIASHVAAHTRSLGADLSAQAGRLWSAGTAQIARTRHEFRLGDAVAAAGYTVMSLYAAGFVAYVAAAF
ncbi:hypothetical protein [Parvibaculum sp.]|jgi:hypothetical protein|uniref:hypothetical protein n=1 Tax=Parvibaculum sp. TaxID=2024848 RepID=UPI002FD8AC12